MGTIIEVKNVSYDYPLGEGKFIRALENLSLIIEEGEYLALIGPNGSGKSTLARHLNALLLPTVGEVRVAGYLTSREEHRWEIRRLVGMVFQNPDNQIVATTVEEDVAFGLENLGFPPSVIRERVAEALELVGLQGFATHAPHLLSGGQKQRLAIAGVIAMRPRCLVLDEPTAMLDPRGKKEVIETVKKMNKQEGITVVHITHFMEEALESDRVVIMDRGQIREMGEPGEIFNGSVDLDAIGLELPTIPRLARMLRAGGLPIPSYALKVNELVNYLC